MIPKNTNFTHCSWMTDWLFEPTTPEKCRILSIAIAILPVIAVIGCIGWCVRGRIIMRKNNRTSSSKKVENTFNKTLEKPLKSKKGHMETVAKYEKIIRDTPYSYDEVMTLAETRFQDHQERREILDGIESKLKRRNYQECVNEAIIPSVYGEEDVYIKYHNLKAESDHTIRKGIFIHQTILAFFDSLPEVDVTPYRAVDIKEGLPLTSQEVMQRARETFSDHKDKEEILQKIDNKLKSCDYERSLRRGTPPYMNSDGYYSSYYGFRMPDEVEVDMAVSQFLRLLPGVDMAPYVGQRLK
jgi:hypothetical protein